MNNTGLNYTPLNSKKFHVPTPKSVGRSNLINNIMLGAATTMTVGLAALMFMTITNNPTGASAKSNKSQEEIVLKPVTPEQNEELNATAEEKMSTTAASAKDKNNEVSTEAQMKNDDKKATKESKISSSKKSSSSKAVSSTTKPTEGSSTEGGYSSSESSK